MGKRSRSREQSPTGRRVPSDAPRRAGFGQRVAAAADRAQERAKQRPPAPWDPFPLSELMILAGILLMVAGAVAGLERQPGLGMAFAGVALSSVGALENMIREHFAGFRSHAGMLAGIIGVIVLVAASMFGASRAVSVAAMLAVVAVSWFPLRRVYLTRAGARRR